MSIGSLKISSESTYTGVSIAQTRQGFLIKYKVQIVISSQCLGPLEPLPV